VDHVTIERYASDLDANLERLSEALRTGTYRPQAISRHYVPKLGNQEMRPLGIPTVQDRVVQTALRMLSNIYLDPLDHLMAAKGFEMVRYADDFVVLCRTPQEAAAALGVVR
jgi:retron-type reverse transcriptase